MSTLRETHRIMRTWTGLIGHVQAAGPSLARFIDPLLALKLQAARLRHSVILPAKGPHGYRH